MLAPKKVKFRKMMKGRMTGKAYRGSQITLGEFGLKALEPGWITSRQIEAARIAITLPNARVWTRTSSASRASPPEISGNKIARTRAGPARLMGS